MNIYEKLAAVQQELKAPKDKKNTFAGYSYRSAEGILEAVKPVLAKYKATIVLSDEIIEISGRVFVKATATFYDTQQKYFIKDETENITPIPNELKDKPISVTAFAREAAEKKGLDVSQVTGTASSYARKYALNGLLLIDDTKDADTDEYAKQTKEDKPEEKPKKKQPLTEYASEGALKTIKIMTEKAGLSLDKILNKPLEQLTANEAVQMILKLRERLGEE